MSDREKKFSDLKKDGLGKPRKFGAIRDLPSEMSVAAAVSTVVERLKQTSHREPMVVYQKARDVLREKGMDEGVYIKDVVAEANRQMRLPNDKYLPDEEEEDDGA